MVAMKDFDRLDIKGNRDELRAWLADNHATAESIFLVRYKKHTEHYLSHGQIAEELLCWGWIDSHARKLDEDRSLLLISPRRPGSPWSAVNKAHIERAIASGAMTQAGLDRIEAAKRDGSWTLFDDVEAMIVPDDLAVALDTAGSRATFDGFPDSSKKGILWWIKSAKRAATRQKRIDETVRLAALNLRANHPEAMGR